MEKLIRGRKVKKREKKEGPLYNGVVVVCEIGPIRLFTGDEVSVVAPKRC